MVFLSAQTKIRFTAIATSRITAAIASGRFHHFELADACGTIECTSPSSSSSDRALVNTLTAIAAMRLTKNARIAVPKPSTNSARRMDQRGDPAAVDAWLFATR